MTDLEELTALVGEAQIIRHEGHESNKACTVVLQIYGHGYDGEIELQSQTPLSTVSITAEDHPEDLTLGRIVVYGGWAKKS